MLTIWVLYIVAHTLTDQAAAQINSHPERASCELAAGSRVHVCVPVERGQ
jgi:hypothetical protein